MRHHRNVTSAVAIVALLAACESGTTDSTTVATTATSTSSTPVPSSTEPSASTAPVALEQPAVWPAAGVVFATPEAAATDFVTSALGVPATLGPFHQGDSRSGEIEVLLAPEGTGEPILRSLLLLRQLGPDNGWFVLAAVNEYAAIAVPAHGATVSPGLVQVEGVARGFEATVIVEAYLAGTSTLLDQQVVMAGNFDAALPFTTTLDLVDAPAGATVMLIVRGGVGLETDPGEFSAIAVLID